ncbi:hypothetical protein AYO21_10090 [Fonsecaea monophora]|uniref:Uncharacterized protein n=1 Tax=Fonsecaea monophora TaxID=254056 RepID=A0A177EVQ4_9EURO|nr:hypothetical protein AYO21_10090 [Fonsecaea monophora]OAG35696.1 hypothetical protein AYO21_10090 [Fonsecaea monophora]
MLLSEEQVRSFRRNGYLVLGNVLSEVETEELQRWAQEVHDWTTDANSPWMPYEEINARGERVLCRTENYADSHAGLNSLLRGQKLLDLLKQLSGEEMLLFKEKINYKLAGSGGFAPHIDATAYTHIKDIKHLAILLAVDPSNISNGGLEVVEGTKVAELVEAHVPAKRYLCATEDEYYNTLSDASKESLRFQGGPMSQDEVQQWRQGDWAVEKANLRRWDDGAKVVGLKVPGLETYRPLLEQVLSS